MIESLKAFFIESAVGSLFSLYYPAQKQDEHKFILHVPAFAEELNCSRQIVDQQCRAFVEEGYSVLLIDLFGTGDSTGDFSSATWAQWKQDIIDASQWLKEQGAESIVLWGLRVGALLAMECVNTLALQVNKLILWQPVLVGETFVMQFLRLKVVASMLDKRGLIIKTSELKQQILKGQSIEVAGYCCHPQLLQPLLQLNAIQQDLCAVKDVLLIEVSSNKNSALSPVNKQFVELLQNKHQNVSVQQVFGDNFWSVHGCLQLPDLMTATVQV